MKKEQQEDFLAQSKLSGVDSIDTLSARKKKQQSITEVVHNNVLLLAKRLLLLRWLKRAGPQELALWNRWFLRLRL